MINVAQIGVGYWGPNLLRNLMTNSRCNLNSVVELDRDRRQFIKEKYPSIHTTSKINDILDDDEIDAIVIATPVKTHFDLAIRCLKSGKHVLVEKPMAESTSQIDKIRNLSNANDLVAMVGHTFLYNQAVREIKKIIDDGILGDIRYIYGQRVNLGRIRNDVDAMWNLAPHDVSIIQYWLDGLEPLDVHRFGMDYVQGGISDVVFLNIKYPKKIMVNLHLSWLDPHKIRKITIVGSKKMVVYDDISNDKIKIYDKGIDRVAELGKKMDFDDLSKLEFIHRSGDINIPKINWVEPLSCEINHFFDCIEKKCECLTGPEHAKNVSKILEMSLK